MVQLEASEIPFALVRCPQLQLRLPNVRLPGSMTVFALIYASYFLVLSGIIYDMINEPPSMGAEVDPVSGKQRPVAVLKDRINGQYIIEGLTAGFLFCLGGAAFIALHVSATSSKSRGPSFRLGMVIAAAIAMTIAYNMCVVFIRIKMPGYLR